MMLSDSELEALIRNSAPRELPAPFRQSINSLLVSLATRKSHPAGVAVWIGAAIVLLSLATLLLSLLGRSGGTIPAHENAAATRHGMRPVPCLTVRAPMMRHTSINDDPLPCGYHIKLTHHVIMRSKDVLRDTLIPRLRFSDVREDSRLPISFSMPDRGFLP